MLTQNIRETFVPTSVQTQAFRNGHAGLVDYGRSTTLSSSRLKFHRLSIEQLVNFEKVTDQFTLYGLHFEDVIAIRPSNQSFLSYECQIVLMPTGQCRNLKIAVEKSVTEVYFGLMGSQLIDVSALDSQGHCVSVGKPIASPNRDAQQAYKTYPEQRLFISNSNAAKVIRLDSKAPFVISQLGVTLLAQSKLEASR